MSVPLNVALAHELLRIGAVKFGAFRLKLHEKHPEAPLSPIYVNLRILRSFPDVLDVAVRALQEATSGIEYALLADVPTAATPLVAVLSHVTRIPMVSPRLERKTHGMITSVEGVFTKGQTVLLVDDLVTTADSKIEAIGALTDVGLLVRDVAVLVDREQGGEQQLARIGINCHGALKVSELLDIYVEVGAIDRQRYDEVVTYLKTPMPS